MKLVNLFLFLALGLALTAAFNNPSVSVEEDFVGRDETTEVAATSMPKSELGDSTGQVSLTLSDGSTKTVDLYRDLKGGVAGHVELDAAQAFVGSEVTWNASGKGIPKLQGTLAKSPEGKHLLALKGKLGEGWYSGRRRGGSLTFSRRRFTAEGSSCSCGGPGSNGLATCRTDSCYNRGFHQGRTIEFWDKSGWGQDFKIELWWRITGSNICLKFMAWEAGWMFYNLLNEGGLDSGYTEKCFSKTEGTTYSQGDIIAEFKNQCDYLESQFQSRCHDQWQSCIHGTGYHYGSGWEVHCVSN